MSKEKKDVIDAVIDNDKQFKMTVKIAEDRIYTITGPGGEKNPELENSKEIESVIYYLLKNVIITNWRKDLIEAENIRAKKEQEKSEVKEETAAIDKEQK